MVNYILNHKLTLLPEADSSSGSVTIMSFNEYNEQFREKEHYPALQFEAAHIRYCKADIMGDHISGTFFIPSKKHLSAERNSFAFYLTDSKLIFIDDQGYTNSILRQLESYPLSGSNSVCHFFLVFIEYLIQDDVFYLQHFEEKLTKLEEEILLKNDTAFNHKIFQIRKNLAVLSAYYEQLQDMGEALQQNPFTAEKDFASPLFGLFAARAGRLYSNVQMLKEYSMQLREMHQTQVDMHQNQIMKFLTIVTTIFMPLTLITGWYGMNFTHMPELNSPFGYLIICVVSLFILIIEIWLFKIKNWFH
jgi:magnesium transporter